MVGDAGLRGRLVVGSGFALGSGSGGWGWSRDAGVFGTVLKYANLPEVRAWRAQSQLDFADVFDVRKPKSVLPVLLSEISTRQKARAVPASGVYVQGVFAAD
jgi:hypothetical protein